MEAQGWIEEANRNLMAAQRAEAERDQWKARAADEARRNLENGTAREKAEAERDALRAELRAERRLKNELVLKAYPAMDERDRLRRWIEELRDWASQVPDMPGVADQKTIGYQMAEDFVRRACDDVLEKRPIGPGLIGDPAAPGDMP